MELKEIYSAAWWELYKNKIVQILNNKRADVTSAMKRIFMSKYGSGSWFIIKMFD
jgi:hypothetical protein